MPAKLNEKKVVVELHQFSLVISFPYSLLVIFVGVK